MRAVIYTEDMEPITVAKLQPWTVDYLRKHGTVRVAVAPPISHMFRPDDKPRPFCAEYIVRLSAHSIESPVNGCRAMFLTTRDDVAALLMDAALLPGQAALRDATFRAGVSAGFQQALDMLGKLS